MLEYVKKDFATDVQNQICEIQKQVDEKVQNCRDETCGRLAKMENEVADLKRQLATNDAAGVHYHATMKQLF